MRKFLALVLVAACAAGPDEVKQAAGGSTNVMDEGGNNSPSCPAGDGQGSGVTIRSVGTYWPKVVGWNNNHPPTQVIFASNVNGFTCGMESLPPDQYRTPNPSDPRPWAYPVPTFRRYPVCSWCAGGWQPNQFFPAFTHTSAGTYAQSTAQACVKMCLGNDYCDSYQRQDAAWQCNAGPGTNAYVCHTW